MIIWKVLKNRFVLITSTIAILGTISYVLFGATTATKNQYKFATVSRGNLETTISSSGTLSPVTQVEVGTQVSGTISKLFVDFNDKVVKGQILAVIDTSVLVLAVADAQSGFIRAEAQLEEAALSFSRSAEMFNKGMLSESEFQTVKTTHKSAQASIISARSALQRTKQNLEYAIIRSPINGTVTARNIEAGQTVAASFATPTLFTIAQDLSKMEIKALIDESDIGVIKEGQRVRFTVQAYPKKIFEGTVKQVRVQPITTANVVNYTVIVSAENKENILLPGMTATVDFIIDEKHDVLMVPNTALRFQPTEEELKKSQEQMGRMMKSPNADSLQQKFGPPRVPFGNMTNMKHIWYLDDNGALMMEPFRAGISDGTNTEILFGRTLKENMQVISGNETSSKTTKARPQQGPPGPPPF